MAKKISPKSQQALDQYLALLHKLGADDSNLLRRRTFITTLIHDLEKIPHDGRVYSTLVDEKLSMFTQIELRNFYQVTAREFYSFWTDDESRINAMMSGGDAISVNPFTITLNFSLDELHVRANAHFKEHPHPALMAYETHLEDAADKAIRLQWAAFLLFAFHDFEQADFTYRAAVDTLLNMIENRTMKQSFLVVVRDFHPIWKNS